MSKIFLNLLLISIFGLSLAQNASEAKSVSFFDAARLEIAGQCIRSKQYKTGYVDFKSMAEKGCPYSQSILGIMRQSGVGVKKSAVQARHWFEKAARQGFADAQERLGMMYLQGEGVRKNLKLARQWLEKAANQGAVKAKELVAQIPGGTKFTNAIAMAPQQVSTDAINVQKSWQGYTSITQELTQLSAASKTKAVSAHMQYSNTIKTY